MTENYGERGPEVVVHLSRANSVARRSPLDYLDPGWLLLVATIVVFGLVRNFLAGTSILWSVGLIVAATVIAWTYYLLRQANVTLYARRSRIGITNALGRRREVAARDVNSLVLCTVALPRRSEPLPMLLAVSAGGRCLFKMSGADLLGVNGIREVADSAGLELRGSWSEVITLDQMVSSYPGATSRLAVLFAFILQHRIAVRVAVIAATILIFVVAAALVTRHQ